MFPDKKKLTIFLLLIASMVQASELVQWTFPSDIETDGERREYFIEIAKQKARGSSEPNVEFHITNYAGRRDTENTFGFNIPFHGPIEQDAYRIIRGLDFCNKEKLAIVLGCGTGRTVIDILKKTEYTRVCANDLSGVQLNILRSNISKLGINGDRLDFSCCDAEILTKELNEKSVDYYYVANLIHFFQPDKTHRLLESISKTLKKNGFVFLSWLGYDPDGNYGELLSQELNTEFQTLRAQVMMHLKDDFGYVNDLHSRPSIRHIAYLASKFGMKILCAEYFYPTSVITKSANGNNIESDYKFELFNNGTQRNCFPTCQMILTKN